MRDGPLTAEEEVMRGLRNFLGHKPCNFRVNCGRRSKKSISFISSQKHVLTCTSSNNSIAMTSAEYPLLSVPAGTADDAAPLSLDELDLTTQGLRQLQRNFILEEPEYSYLLI